MPKTTKYMLGKGSLEQARTLTLEPVSNINEANWVVLPGSNPELVPIVKGLKDGDMKFGVYNFQKWEASQMLSARSAWDLGDYANPATTVGLHVHPEVDLEAIRNGVTNLFEVENLGSVHVGYQGNLIHKPPQDVLMDGWCQVDYFNKLTRFSKYTDNRSKEQKLFPLTNPPTNVLRLIKHGWIDAIIQGFTLVAWVAHHRRKTENNPDGNNNFLATFVKQWEMTSLKKAREYRAENYARKIEHDRYVLPVQVAAYEQTNGNGNGNGVPVAPTGEVEVPAAPTITSSKGEAVDMSKLDKGKYAIARNGTPMGFAYDWTPGDTQRINFWAGLVAEGFEIVLPA